MGNLSRNDILFITLGGIISLLLIVKYGIIAYLLIVALFYIFKLILLQWDMLFNPKNPYRKLDKWLSACFSLDNATWMNSSLDSEFSALEHFCKKKKKKVTLYLDQIDAIAAIYNSSKDDSDEKKGAIKGLSRVESFQKAGIIKYKSKVPVPTLKRTITGTGNLNVLTGIVTPEETSSDIEGSGNIDIISEGPIDPKLPSPKAKYFNALKTYIDNCGGIVAYVSEDPELRVRVRNFMAENSGKKIEIVPISDFKKSAAYINRFKFKFIETQKKKRTESKKKWDNRRVQLKEFIAAISDIKTR